MFVSTRRGETPLSVTPPRPSISSSIAGKLPIEILVKKDDFDFPTTLPLLNISKGRLDRNIVLEFSNKLGLGENIEEFEDINEGIKYYTNSDKYFLVATPKTSMLQFGLSSNEFPNVVKKALTDEDVSRIATEFVVKNGFYSRDQIQNSPVKYYRRANVGEGLEASDRGSAEVFQVGFILKSADYEILSSFSTNSLISVQMLPDGQIYNAEILLVGEPQKGITEYPLKRYDDLAANLNEARLISLYGDYISPSDTKIQNITSLKVEKIRLAYLLEEGKENFLQPIFLLEGPASIISSSVNYATLYMPAYK